ncbi:hypothetical protein E2C01_090277 [Portunus trituberculatus]|uniref:EGF-like domain-containing protein n=1 Tax=Portunus trituberculatus TaxID=210409 RepID=A0A5B7JB13_PORTR|nr:hypothetical protein [Portunus trituberculatus]
MTPKATDELYNGGTKCKCSLPFTGPMCDVLFMGPRT